MTRILGRDDFIGTLHLKRELVEVPDLGGSLWLREITTPDMLKYRDRTQALSDESGGRISATASLQLMALAVSYSACDEQGNLLFTEEDVQRLMNNRIAVLEMLATKALELSGVHFDADRGLTSEVAVNLKKDQTSGSSSSLPRNSRKPRKRS